MRFNEISGMIEAGLLPAVDVGKDRNCLPVPRTWIEALAKDIHWPVEKLWGHLIKFRTFLPSSPRYLIPCDQVQALYRQRHWGPASKGGK
jgi:hypothetical protein